MARLPDLVAFAQRHGLKIGTISDLIAYRRRHDNLVRETAVETVTSEYGGAWQMRVFTDTAGGGEHIVLSKGDLATPEPVLVRMHAMNPLEDLLGIHAGRSHQLRDAMRAIAAEGRGVVVLLRDMATKLEHRRPRLAAPAAAVRHRRADPDRARPARADAPDQLAEPAAGRARRLRPLDRRHPADPALGGLTMASRESHYTLPPPALRAADAAPRRGGALLPRHRRRADRRRARPRSTAAGRRARDDRGAGRARAADRDPAGEPARARSTATSRSAA